ncbi:Radial spoke head 14 -like protein [Collichthys lucidus]|uniref:Radial spoke head 14-like protein n=1 Tax=Collichthys lucidus TaxID=240159 RepID=A0A4U5UVS8_COLLU|nr:Radial spoke head 14 -like protein [Collichthys lucidus]
MAASLIDPSRAPVAFGRRAVPQLFEELQQRPEAARRQRALNSLCDLMHNPERVYQTVTGGFLEQVKVLFQDEDADVRTKTCDLLHVLTSHSVGRQALLSSSLLPPLSQLLDDPSSSCRRSVHRVLTRLTLLPAGADALLTLVPKLMLKLRQEKEEEEVQALILSTLSSCSYQDPRPALANDGVSLLGHILSHRSTNIRREAADALMALSVCRDGKEQVCEQNLLPVLVGLLQDEDLEVQVNAVGVIMFTVTITTGKQQCLDLDVLPVLLDFVSKKKEEEEEEQDEERRRRRKALVLYSLRALTALAEAPGGRHLLLEQLPVLEARTESEEDQDIRRSAQDAVHVITWTP